MRIVSTLHLFLLLLCSHWCYVKSCTERSLPNNVAIDFSRDETDVKDFVVPRRQSEKQSLAMMPDNVSKDFETLMRNHFIIRLRFVFNLVFRIVFDNLTKYT